MSKKSTIHPLYMNRFTINWMLHQIFIYLITIPPNHSLYPIPSPAIEWSANWPINEVHVRNDDILSAVHHISTYTISICTCGFVFALLELVKQFFSSLDIYSFYSYLKITCESLYFCTKGYCLQLNRYVFPLQWSFS